MNPNDMIQRISRSTTIALLVSPVGLLIISAARLLIISNYDPATALAITSSQGYINTLLGTIIPIVPIYIPYLALLLLFSGRIIPGALALLATTLISPPSIDQSDLLSIIKKNWNLIIAGSGTRHALLIIVAIPFGIFLIVELIGLDFIVFVRTFGIVASLAFAPLIVRLYPLPLNNGMYVTLIRQPWLPAETMALASHQEITGYVLSSDGYWLEVLIANDRKIEYYRVSDVSEREICRTNKLIQARPLFPLAPAQVTISLCPQPTEGAKATPSWLLPIFNFQGPPGTAGNICTAPIPAVCQQSSGEPRE